MVGNKVRILLTGSTGYIGKFIYTKLSCFENCDLYTLKQDCTGSDKCINWDQISYFDFEYVINCIGESENTETMDYKNITLCQELFERLNLGKLKKFIHLSTVAIYNQNVRGPIMYNGEINVDSKSKYTFDVYLNKQSCYKDKVFIIRPSNVMFDVLPGKLLFKLSRLGIKFFSFKKRYINWCPGDLIYDIIVKLLRNERFENIIVANKYLELNSFYIEKLPRFYFIFIPVEFAKYLLFIFWKKKSLQKFNQLFSQHYFRP